MFSVRSRELWPFYRLTLFEAQAEVIFTCAGELTHLKSLGVDVSHSSSNAHHDFPFCSVLSRQRPATSEFATGAWFVACDAALMPCWN